MVDSRIVLDSLPDPTWRRSRDRVVEGADLTPTAAMTSSGRFTVRDSTSPCRAAAATMRSTTLKFEEPREAPEAVGRAPVLPTHLADTATAEDQLLACAPPEDFFLESIVHCCMR
jgi:hypothetical protein